MGGRRGSGVDRTEGASGDSAVASEATVIGVVGGAEVDAGGGAVATCSCYKMELWKCRCCGGCRIRELAR